MPVSCLPFACPAACPFACWEDIFLLGFFPLLLAFFPFTGLSLWLSHGLPFLGVINASPARVRVREQTGINHTSSR